MDTKVSHNHTEALLRLLRKEDEPLYDTGERLIKLTFITQRRNFLSFVRLKLDSGRKRAQVKRARAEDVHSQQKRFRLCYPQLGSEGSAVLSALRLAHSAARGLGSNPGVHKLLRIVNKPHKTVAPPVKRRPSL